MPKWLAQRLKISVKGSEVINSGIGVGEDKKGVAGNGVGFGLGVGIGVADGVADVEGRVCVADLSS